MSINWFTYDRYEEAIAASAANDKPILIYFHSKSCNGCQSLATDVFSNAVVLQAIEKSTIPVWVEVEVGHAEPKISRLVGSHIFIMSPVIQLISSHGDIFHKFLGAPLHTRLDLGYTRVHHDIYGDLDVSRFLAQLALGLGKRHVFLGDYLSCANEFESLSSTNVDKLTASEIEYWMPVAKGHGKYSENADFYKGLTACSDVVNEVRRFCYLITKIPDSELMVDWPGKAGHGGWVHYTDCLREVCLGVYQTLKDVGNSATNIRNERTQSLTQTQLILKDWQTSYRMLQGVIQGLTCEDWDRQHLHENYTLGKQRTIRNNIVHCVMAEFWAHGSAIRAARLSFSGAKSDNTKPVVSTWQKYGPPPVNFGAMSDLMNTWEIRHNELMAQVSDIGDEELDFARGWWEDTDVSIRFRLNRLGWHLQDHAAVIETICERIGRVRSETERLSTRIFTALGAAEGSMIGLSTQEQKEMFANATDLLRAKSDEIQELYGKYLLRSGITQGKQAKQTEATEA